MGNTIVKIAPDRDEYVIWSSNTETPLWLGTRAELLEELGDIHGECPTCHSRISWIDTTRARIERADERGSSSGHGSWWWEYNGEPYKGIYAQLGLVARENLPAIVELLTDYEVDDPQIVALLEPFEDEPRAAAGSGEPDGGRAS